MGGNEVDFESDRFAGRGDDFYALLMKAHEGLSEAESIELNARLVLLLANQVGDIDVLEKLLEVASKTVGGEREGAK